MTGSREMNDAALEWLDYARARLAEIKQLAENKLPNRLIVQVSYYALLSAVVSMLHTRNLAGAFDTDDDDIEHDRMIWLFHKEFVQENDTLKSAYSALCLADEVRHDNERNPEIDVSGDDAVNTITASEYLVETAASLL